MKQIDLREGARRQHRAIALFAVIQCWILNLDGVAFQRRQLERLLGLDRFKRTRVEWLREDLKEFFPHSKVYWFAKRKDSLHSIIASRKPIDAYLPSGKMKTAERIQKMKKGSPKIGLFQMWKVPSSSSIQTSFEGVVPFFADSVNYHERFLSAYLALLAQGQISPHSLPPLKEDQDDA